MKLTQKQMANPRSGQTFYGVWGNTPNDLYVYCQRFVGKRAYHFIKEMGDSYVIFDPETTFKSRYGFGRFNFAQGQRGAFADRQWTKRSQAERFLQEVKDGLHPQLMLWWRDRCHACDEMDEAFGIDRGLGGVTHGFEDGLQDPWSWDEDYMEDEPEYADTCQQDAPQPAKLGGLRPELGDVLADKVVESREAGFNWTRRPDGQFLQSSINGKPIDDEGVPPGPPVVKRVRRVLPDYLKP